MPREPWRDEARNALRGVLQRVGKLLGGNEKQALGAVDKSWAWLRLALDYADAADKRHDADEAENARLRAFVAAYDCCDSNRGRFSCVPAHDGRCDKDRRISDICTCGGDALEAARAALEEPHA